MTKERKKYYYLKVTKQKADKAILGTVSGPFKESGEVSGDFWGFENSSSTKITGQGVGVTINETGYISGDFWGFNEQKESTSYENQETAITIGESGNKYGDFEKFE
jgi:hypothetical protein